MGILNKFLRSKNKTNKLDEMYDMLDHAKNRIVKELTELLSDPDLEVRKDCSQHILDVVIPIIENQKQSYERDNAIEKLTVLAKEMRAPANELEKIALNSAAFYYTLNMMKQGAPEE